MIAEGIEHAVVVWFRIAAHAHHTVSVVLPRDLTAHFVFVVVPGIGRGHTVDDGQYAAAVAIVDELVIGVFRLSVTHYV
jgi:hypothetical protein